MKSQKIFFPQVSKVKDFLQHRIAVWDKQRCYQIAYVGIK